MPKITAVVALALTLTALTGSPSFATNEFPEDRPPIDIPRDEPRGDYSDYDCSDQLGYLRRVYEEQIDLIIDDDRVSVVPVCEGSDYGFFRNAGNVGTLRTHISYNDAIMDALGQRNYDANDVVGVRMIDDDAAIIFVHRFHD
jgi:hypothetical protein